jgi:hypothetical protein
MPINAKRLTKHYPKLPPRDRFRLMMAARQRGDGPEARRLIDSSPKKTFQVPHYRGYSEAFLEVTGCHVTFQLELGVHMWKCLARMNGTTDHERIRAKVALRLLAGLFRLRQQAWEMLCREYGCDGRGVLSAHPAGASLEELEGTAAEHAFSRDEVKILLGTADAEVISVEDIYEDMKAAIEERATWWM